MDTARMTLLRTRSGREGTAGLVDDLYLFGTPVVAQSVAENRPFGRSHGSPRRLTRASGLAGGAGLGQNGGSPLYLSKDFPRHG